ncbi:carbohydrate-binding module family 35 protein [Durotheca rogersii]|uniref:carbohydrate-binding module family 35 protein n=1 Tax=Durotheca rogersii TaxID=419775 RepID=UPI00221E8D05|nr:carbohydrate-binding module family 35 protein [Durotheca rogersii]KAI5863627.1 carbohydrate-binding module family 35 protein [Durotheca rogersii]
MHPLRALLLGALASLAEATLQIVPGATWTTSNNEHLQAHGPGVIKVDSTYYLIGEDKTNGSAFQNVNCYSSQNLVEWTYEGALLSRTAEAGDLGPNRVVERPKVVYNARTRQYVLYLHIDSSNYGEAKVGVATGTSVCGTYAYRGSFRPQGRQSRDMGLFVDDDGAGYLLTEDRESGLRILRLADDYLSVAADTHLWSDSIESPALVRLAGRYYVFGSKLTGWDPNDNVYSTATALAGPWSAWQTFAAAGSKTYTSQTSFVLPVGGDANGSAPTGALYLGDRWVSRNLMASTYVWLPLRIAGATVSLDDAESWVPDLGAASGARAKPAETSYEGEAAAYGGGARDVQCGACSGGVAAGYLGGPAAAAGTVTFTGVRSDADARTTVRVRYANGDSAPRYARVRVNGGAPATLAFLPTAGAVSASTLHADLRAGAQNEIVFEGVGDGRWGPDIDRLIVPVQ